VFCIAVLCCSVTVNYLFQYDMNEYNRLLYIIIIIILFYHLIPTSQCKLNRRNNTKNNANNDDNNVILALPGPLFTHTNQLQINDLLNNNHIKCNNYSINFIVNNEWPLYEYTAKNTNNAII
jgi:hypothetical protein